jgi:hypothetical protein
MFHASEVIINVSYDCSGMILYGRCLSFFVGIFWLVFLFCHFPTSSGIDRRLLFALSLLFHALVSLLFRFLGDFIAGIQCGRWARATFPAVRHSQRADFTFVDTSTISEYLMHLESDSGGHHARIVRGTFEQRLEFK